jgi:hypothetical protein
VSRDRATRPQDIATCTGLNVERAYRIRQCTIIDFAFLQADCPPTQLAVSWACDPQPNGEHIEKLPSLPRGQRS